MKLFWFLLIVFYAFIDQASPLVGFTDDEVKLVNELGLQISDVLKAINAPEISLGDDDPPLVQNFTNSDDESLNGNLVMCNVVIDGLSNIEDVTDIVKDKLEIRMTLNLKKLVIRGDFFLETPAITAEENGTFSVTLINVSVEAVASLLANPYGNLVISKVVPTVSSEESHVIVKSKMTPPSGPILKSAQMHLQKNMEKRFAKIAYLEVYMHYPRKSGHTAPQTNWTIFEAQRFVSQHYDPYRIEMAMYDTLPWHVGAFRLHGLSNFHLDEINLLVENSNVDILFRILTENLYGSFPFISSYHGNYIGEFTIEKMEFIGKMSLMGDGSQKFPIMAGIGLQITGCRCRVLNKATGMPAGESEFGFDAEDLFCLLFRNEFSTTSILESIQTKILNKVELSRLKLQIAHVLDAYTYY